MILGKRGTGLMILAWLGIAALCLGAAVLAYWLASMM
jgi:hypothetical protein